MIDDSAVIKKMDVRQNKCEIKIGNKFTFAADFLSFYIYFFLIVFTQLYIVFTYLSTYHLSLMCFSLLCIITPVKATVYFLSAS